MNILVTGSAGFIGMHLVLSLCHLEDTIVVGVDNINDYYDTKLKYARLKACGISQSSIMDKKRIISEKFTNYSFIKADITDYDFLLVLCEKEKFDIVYHLAAQAGVRHSITHPREYIDSNIYGFFNILEACRYTAVKHLIYASSSSVYGSSNEMPLSETMSVNHPVSLYAASKKSNEMMANAYAELYGFKCTGLRFFTVYGPWGRPDMAPYLFTEAIVTGLPINVFNNGDMERDFTYITDIIDGMLLLMQRHKQPTNVTHRIYNIGASSPIKLNDFIDSLEKALQLIASRVNKPMQAGDVKQTYANVDRLKSEFGYRPKVNLSLGVKLFVDWYKEYEELR